MTQNELATRTNVDADTISAVEAGGGTVTVLVAILSTLEVTVNGHDPSEIGSWLRNTRVGKGWSQQRLATTAGISKPTVIGLERGRGHVTSFTAALNALVMDIRLDLTPRSATVLRAVGRDKFAVVHGDAQSVLTEFPEHQFHACVTDPPYGLTEYPSELVTESSPPGSRGTISISVNSGVISTPIGTADCHSRLRGGRCIGCSAQVDTCWHLPRRALSIC